MSDGSWHEYGYRTEKTGEVWAEDYGPDGAWTPAVKESGLRCIDMYDGSEVTAIYRELDRAGVIGEAIRRLITRTEGETEPVPRIAAP